MYSWGKGRKGGDEGEQEQRSKNIKRKKRRKGMEKRRKKNLQLNDMLSYTFILWKLTNWATPHHITKIRC